MGAPLQVPVGQFLPDTPDFEADGCTEALNVIPAVKSYRPFQQFGSFSNALTARAQGAIFAKRSDGGGAIFAGDATKLYKLATATFTDVSGPAAPYSTPADGMWAFIEFGTNIIASNGADPMQTFNVDTDSAFSTLGGSPPQALYLCVAGDFVMTLNTATNRNRLQWSGINNSTQWTPNQTTMADYQDLPDGGEGTGLVGINQAAVVFQRNAVRLASFIGTPDVFQIQKIGKDIGCVIPGSLAAYKDNIFFYDSSGFWMLMGAQQFVPIGAQKVNQWFRSGPFQINMAYLFRCTSAIDPINSLYIMSYPSQNSADGTPDHAILFNWDVGWWAHASPGNLEMIWNGATQHSWTLEELDGPYATLEVVPYPLDSPYWIGVAIPGIGAFGTDHKFGFFAGDAMAATVDTTEAEPIDGLRSFIRSARPIVQAAGGAPDIAITLGTRNVISDAVTWGSPVTVDQFGRCNFRSNARYQRGRITIAAAESWQHIQGIDIIEVGGAGKR